MQAIQLALTDAGSSMCHRNKNMYSHGNKNMYSHGNKNMYSHGNKNMYSLRDSSVSIGEN